MRTTTLAILGMLAMTGCSNELHGTLEVTARGKTWSVTPEECISGQRQGFFGVDARQVGHDDASIRVINDPRASYTLRLGVPGSSESLLVEPGDGCTTFDLTVVPQNSTINDVTNVEGRIKVVCDRPDLKIRADITFKNCH